MIFTHTILLNTKIFQSYCKYSFPFFTLLLNLTTFLFYYTLKSIHNFPLPCNFLELLICIFRICFARDMNGGFEIKDGEYTSTIYNMIKVFFKDHRYFSFKYNFTKKVKKNWKNLILFFSGAEVYGGYICSILYLWY